MLFLGILPANLKYFIIFAALVMVIDVANTIHLLLPQFY